MPNFEMPPKHPYDIRREEELQQYASRITDFELPEDPEEIKINLIGLFKKMNGIPVDVSIKVRENEDGTITLSF